MQGRQSGEIIEEEDEDEVEEVDAFSPINADEYVEEGLPETEAIAKTGDESVVSPEAPSLPEKDEPRESTEKK